MTSICELAWFFSASQPGYYYSHNYLIFEAPLAGFFSQCSTSETRSQPFTVSISGGNGVRSLVEIPSQNQNPKKKGKKIVEKGKRRKVWRMPWRGIDFRFFFSFRVQPIKELNSWHGI